jgi:folylpolyglutamate synthase/dihydropteroate synthase
MVLSQSLQDLQQALQSRNSPAIGNLAGSSDLVVVAGSLYLVGEVLAIVEGREARGPVAM